MHYTSVISHYTQGLALQLMLHSSNTIYDRLKFPHCGSGLGHCLIKYTMHQIDILLTCLALVWTRSVGWLANTRSHLAFCWAVEPRVLVSTSLFILVGNARTWQICQIVMNMCPPGEARRIGDNIGRQCSTCAGGIPTSTDKLLLYMFPEMFNFLDRFIT